MSSTTHTSETRTTAATASRAAAHVVQRKAVIGQRNDPYEREADAVADRVVAGEAVPVVSSLPAGGLGTQAQRQTAEEEEERIQLQVEEEEEPVQLTCAGCAAEEQAVQRQAKGEEKEELVQLQAEAEEEEPVQSKGEDGGGTSMAAMASQAIRSKGPGAPMYAPTRHVLAARMGTDLSGVRVHSGPSAEYAAERLNARAFSHQNHIWMGRSASQDDLHLMAHETTHVLQQGGIVRRMLESPIEDPIDEPFVPTSVVTVGTNPTPPSSTQSLPSGDGAAGAVEAPAVSAEGTQASVAAPSETGAEAPQAEAPAPATPVGTAEEAPAEETGPEAEAAPGAGPPGGVGAGAPAEGAPVEAAAGGTAAGGAAVGAEAELLMPEPPEGLSPEEQARVQDVQGRVAGAASATQQMPPAATSTTEARGAVEEPQEETAARAQSALVGALDERPAPSPQIEELCERIRELIRSKRPADEESLVEADPQEMASEAGSQLNTAVEGDAHRIEGEYDQLQEPAEGTPQQQAQPMEGPPETVATPAINAEAATPDGVPAEDVSLDADVEAQQTRMDEAGMTSEPAQLVETGPVAEAREAQGELSEMAERDPAEVMAEQEAALASAQGDMASLQQAALEALSTARGGTVRRTTGRQQQMVGSEEQMRTQASAEAQRIFTDAQTRVRSLLEPLPQTAMQRWESGVAILSRRFEDRLQRVEAWVEERHSGVGGAVLSVWDAVAGMPDWVTHEYDAAERQFGDDVCNLIREISTEVNSVIAAAEAIIAEANQQIDDLFASLPAELQEWAVGEQARFAEQLNGLRQEVQQAQENVNNQLAERAASAVQEVRERIQTLREAAGGLVGRIAAAVDAFLEDPAKFIIEGLLSLLGIDPAAFWAVVNRIQQVINDIANDPETFANNLLEAIGKGFEQFFDHITDHLLGGLLEWLFSGLGAVGVEIPSDFSLKSVITFFLQLMGITWERVRRLLAKHIGEENVALIERAYEIVATLIELGPEGVFELIKEQLNPQNILNMVLEAAIEFLVEALIKQIAMRLIAMFNPVGAIVQAIEAIYRVLKWIFENAARIFSLIETIVNGIADIIAGNIGGMANAIEQALARLIAPVIDFLAGFLGLGDLPDKIADVIRGMQEWVEGILDRVIGFIAAQARRLLSAVGFGGDEEAVEEDDPEKAERIRVGLAALDQEEERVLENGKLSRQDAEAIATRVQRDHPVFTSITVVDGGNTWDYEYTASPGRVKEGEEKEEEGLSGSPSEFTEVSLWEQAAAQVSASEIGPTTRLSQRSKSYNLTVLQSFIDRSTATPARKAAAHQAVIRHVNAAMEATDGDAIYNRLRNAARAVNQLYDQDVVQLQVHHEERVSEHPATFAQTRAERIRARIRRRINNDVNNLTPEEREIAAISDRNQRNELIRILAERMLEEDIEEGPELLNEVDMDVLTREAHLGEVHGRR